MLATDPRLPLQAYAFPNMSVDIKLCRCNIAPKTIVRGPGFLNAALVAEHVLEHVAQHLDLDPVLVRERNFLTSLASPPCPSPLAHANPKAGAPLGHEHGGEFAQHCKAPASEASAAQAVAHDQRDKRLPGPLPCRELQSPARAARWRMMLQQKKTSLEIRQECEGSQTQVAPVCHPRVSKSPINPPQPSSAATGPCRPSLDQASGYCDPVAHSSDTPAATPAMLQTADSSACGAPAPVNRPFSDAASSLPPADIGVDATSACQSMTHPRNAAEHQAATRSSAENAAASDARSGASTAATCSGHSNGVVEAASPDSGEDETTASPAMQTGRCTAAGWVASRPCHQAKRTAPADDVLQPGDVRTPLGT